MKNFHPTGNCPIRDVLSRLGDKWSMLVLITLNANGTMRFSDIHKTIEDVSQRMLTVTLRTLESDGLVERKVYAEVPPRVEYCLTDTGGSITISIDKDNLFIPNIRISFVKVEFGILVFYIFMANWIIWR